MAFCTTCGTKIVEGCKFCTGCGRPLQAPAQTATPEQADETCGVIRECVAELYGREAAEEIIIQYGGSMNDGNAAELLAKVNVDGGLIGGASLKTDKFTAIVKAANA